MKARAILVGGSLVLALTGASRGAEQSGVITLRYDATTVAKRYVVRVPEPWNGRLVIGAHGGTGGERLDIEGDVVGTDETALDDVVGTFAVERGFAYASVDRDGLGGTREGLALVDAFTEAMRARLAAAGRPPSRVYLVGLSMGGALARYAAEEDPPRYDGVVILAGAGGDVATRLEREARMATLWPAVSSGLPDDDPRVLAYAEAVATPVAARPLWGFLGRSASVDRLRTWLADYGLSGLSDEELARFRFDAYRDRPGFARAVAAASTTGRLRIPAIELVGTFDDLVRREVLVYREKVRRDGADGRYRLYEVEGAWHIAGDDDAMETFRFLARRQGLGETADRAMANAPSYLKAARDALVLLDGWVVDGKPPPASRRVRPGESLLP